MGADCCGGGVEKGPAACQAVTKDFGVASENLAPHADGKQWDEIVKEKRAYYDQRVHAFEAIKAKYDASLEAAKVANVQISIEMPDGSARGGVQGVTTPMDVAMGISKGLAKKSVVARVDGGVWDMMRPLEGDCKLELVTFDDPDGKEVRGVVLCFVVLCFVVLCASFVFFPLGVSCCAWLGSSVQRTVLV